MDESLLDGHKACYGPDKEWKLRNKALTVFEEIRNISGEGKTPITYLVLGGHGYIIDNVTTGLTQKDSYDIFTADTIINYESYPIYPNGEIGLKYNYDFSLKKNRRGPRRCWFSKNSKVIFPGRCKFFSVKSLSLWQNTFAS